MKLRPQIVIGIALALMITCTAHATHNRAGEITYRHIEGYTFEFTVTTYTYAPSNANRDALYVNWGDGTYQEVGITQRSNLPNQYLYNSYVTRHTFPGPGTYQILMEDPNRNLGVKNIPNSVQTIFSIKTTMLIGTYVGTNSTPVLLNPPVDNAAKNHVFIHNPSAYDADGDSVSYELTVCTAERGKPIEGYSLPPASDTLFIDPYFGDLTWVTPVDTGVYNIAIFIDEWRNGIKIGRITRDMQIDVYNTDNNPPVNDPIANYCIEAGDSVVFYITSTDIDNDPVEQFLAGAPIYDNSATLELVEGGAGFSTSKFVWKTNCTHARQQPYTLVIKSQDQVNDVSLVDITSFYVRVLHKAPQNVMLDPGTDHMNITWDASNCGSPIGYNIYRRRGPSGFVPDSCENGVPSYTGYELVDVVFGTDSTRYIDDNLGQGLVPGFDYCYLITSIYNDRAESFASEEVCASLIPGVPSMLEVSVLSDDPSNGQISVKWAVPIDFDTVDDGPYRYELFRLTPEGTDYELIATIPTVDLLDTAYIDQNINTLKYPYYYSAKVVYEDDAGNWITHPGSENASSLYLNLLGLDNTIEIDMQKRAPWLNYEYDIYRKPETGSFDSLTTTTNAVYNDTGLANSFEYTYRVKSHGLRPLNNTDYLTTNISHINTTSAFDSINPCTPTPEVVSICDSSYNVLSWLSSKALCGDNDVVNYQIYYRPTLEGDFDLIETLPSTDTTFIHRVDLETLAAVYGIVAVDSFNNSSGIGLVSIDSCIMFSLPNVFSPNADGNNDIYTAYNLGGFVNKVEMQIFNRYGSLVYETNEPYINWDGYHKDSHKLVSTGVYYYICDVYEPRLTGEVHRVLKGFIHVYSGDDNKRPE